MSDSRGAAEREFSKDQWPLNARITYFLLCLTTSLALTFYIASGSYTDSEQYVLFIFFFSIGLWLTEAIPPFSVGILIIGYLVYTQGSEYLNNDPESVDRYIRSWISPVIWLMLGGFFMAEGMSKTGLDRNLLKLALSQKIKKPKYLLLSIMIITALSSMIMSNSATTAMMLAGVMPLVGVLGKDHRFSKGLILAIPAAASIGGMGTIIGSPPNAIAVGVLSESYNINIDFIDWMLVGVPIAFTLIFIFWLVLSSKFVNGLELPDMEEISKEIKVTEVKKSQRRIVLGTLVITLLMWMTTPLHHIPTAVVSGFPIIALSVGGVLNSDDVRKLPWDTLMLVAGGLSLGVALSHTGLIDKFVGNLNFIPVNFIALTLLAGYLTIFLSNVMSNTAAATILIPVGASLITQDPTLAVMTIGLAASAAMFFPVSTPPNAIAYSTGTVNAKDFYLGGFVVGILAPVVIILFMIFS